MRKIISTHALREEGDHHVNSINCVIKDFYPRPPRGGRRINTYPDFFRVGISIHALREEGDGAKADRAQVNH